jgi:hypothetical protein
MRRRNPPTHDAAAQVRFSSTGLTERPRGLRKLCPLSDLLVIKPMSQMGQSRKWPRISGMTALLSRADIARPSFTLLLVHSIIPKAIDFFLYPPADVPPA